MWHLKTRFWGEFWSMASLLSNTRFCYSPLANFYQIDKLPFNSRWTGWGVPHHKSASGPHCGAHTCKRKVKEESRIAVIPLSSTKMVFHVCTRSKPLKKEPVVVWHHLCRFVTGLLTPLCQVGLGMKGSLWQLRALSVLYLSISLFCWGRDEELTINKQKKILL